MKHLIIIIALALAQCRHSQKIPLPAPDASTHDSTHVSPDNGAAKNSGNEADTLPACVKNIIESFKNADVGNPPRSVYSYSYKGKTVYYTAGPCCDNFSDLYDDKCTLLGHPDGGFTGRGDGRFPDFRKMATNEKLVWKDNRK